MTYTKNHDPWTSSHYITAADMQNFETMYDEAAVHLAAHTHDNFYSQAYMDSTFWRVGVTGSGTGSDADAIYKSTGNLHASDLGGLGVDAGIIVLWYGSVASIDDLDGWHLCDGTAGTVDLVDHFVVCGGAGTDYAIGAIGGSTTFTASGSISVSTHILTIPEMGPHRHPFLDKCGHISSTGYSGSSVLASNTYNTGNTPSAGSGSGHGHSTGEGTHFDGNAVTCMPHYYALCYIQKV